MTSPLSRRSESSLTGEDWWNGSMTVIKQLLRSYNRLRLYLGSTILRVDRISACNDELTHPRRIRFAPLYLKILSFLFINRFYASPAGVRGLSAAP